VGTVACPPVSPAVPCPCGTHPGGASKLPPTRDRRSRAPAGQMPQPRVAPDPPPPPLPLLTAMWCLSPARPPPPLHCFKRVSPPSPPLPSFSHLFPFCACHEHPPPPPFPLVRVPSSERRRHHRECTCYHRDLRLMGECCPGRVSHCFSVRLTTPFPPRCYRTRRRSTRYTRAPLPLLHPVPCHSGERRCKDRWTKRGGVN
jgi:hypothetical protein